MILKDNNESAKLVQVILNKCVRIKMAAGCSTVQNYCQNTHC